VYVLFGRSDWDGAVDVVAEADLVFRGFTGNITVASGGNLAVDGLGIDDLVVSTGDGVFLFEGRPRAEWNEANTLFEEHFVATADSSVDLFFEALDEPWTRALNSDLSPDDVDVFWHWSTGKNSGAFDAGGTGLLNGAIYFGKGEGDDGSGGGTYDEDNAVGESVLSFGTAATPAFTIPSTAHSAELSFNYFLETEGFPGFDVAQVLVNGTPLPQAANVSGGALIDGSGQWQSATVDLSVFIGQTVSIQFSFNSIDEFSNDFEGWYVDDVKVTFRGFTPADAMELPAAGAGISEALVAGVGDMNGDGRDDLAVVTNTETHIIFGRETAADLPAVVVGSAALPENGRLVPETYYYFRFPTNTGYEGWFYIIGSETQSFDDRQDLIDLVDQRLNQSNVKGIEAFLADKAGNPKAEGDRLAFRTIESGPRAYIQVIGVSVPYPSYNYGSSLGFDAWAPYGASGQGTSFDSVVFTHAAGFEGLAPFAAGNIDGDETEGPADFTPATIEGEELADSINPSLRSLVLTLNGEPDALEIPDAVGQITIKELAEDILQGLLEDAGISGDVLVEARDNRIIFTTTAVGSGASLSVPAPVSAYGAWLKEVATRDSWDLMKACRPSAKIRLCRCSI